ncbi:MAG: molybdopterin-dependent oxidoreductase, partial [Pseudonocardia sp.]|nr:molybdopterin-dependent oxidoreductase [Pseudonocardia sp.]
RPAALLLPRGRSYGDGLTDFQINRTASAAGVTEDMIGSRWRLNLTGTGTSVSLDAASLAALFRHTVELPLACVEGWSTVQTWTGVRLRDLAVLAGVPSPASAVVRSLEQSGAFGTAALTQAQVLDPDSLLATEVNGVPLSLDHGAPARIIAPALPGVHCTKWVGSIEFRGAT